MADEGENETCDQTRQNPRQVSLYYVALFCPRTIFSPGRHCYSLKETNTIYSRELFSYYYIKSAYLKEMHRKRQTKFMHYPTKWNWSKRKQIWSSSYEGWNVISIDDRVTSDHRLLRVLHKNEKALTERSLRVVVIWCCMRSQTGWCLRKINIVIF